MNPNSRPTTGGARGTRRSLVARTGIGLLAAAIVLVNAAFGTGIAWADTASGTAAGTLSNLGLSISADGSAPFDADDAAGDDSSPTNGIVRTHDTVTYRWDYTVATAGPITFVQTLPAGMTWQSQSAASCAEGAAAISGSTLSCTISQSQPGVASYGVTALVGGLANGTVLSTTVSSSGLTSTAASVKVSAAPRYQIELLGLQPGGTATGTGAYAGQAGYTMSSGVSIWADNSGAKGAMGIEPLGSSYSFDVALTSPTVTLGAVSSTCAASNQWTSQPAGSGGGAKAVPRTGTIGCVQAAGAGGTVHVTITNADTTLAQWPTQSVTGIALPAGRAYIGVAQIGFWVPQSAFPLNTSTQIVERLSGFAPTSASGQSNYGTGSAPNQQAGAACVTSAPANCNTTTLSTKQSNLSPLTRVWQPGTSLTLPGGTSPSAGDSPAYPGQKFDEIAQMTNPVGNVTQTGVSQCVAWDSTLQQLDTSRSPSSVSSGQTYSYASVTFANNAARKAFDCTDPSIVWSSTPSAVITGGATVDAVRITKAGLAPGASMGATLPFIRTTNALTVGTVIPIFSAVVTAQRPTLQPSTYNEVTNANVDGGGGNRVLAQSAQVRVAAAWGATSAAPGSDQTITLTPSVTANGVTATAASTVLTLQLPSPCVSYIVGSASIAPTSITPANTGADGVPCTGDDGAGALLTWNLGSVTTGAEPTVTLSVGLDPLTDTPSTSTVTAVISSPTDTAPVANRTAVATIGVNAVAAFSLTLQSSTTLAAPNQPFDYTIGWANERSVSAGTGSFAFLLPAVGDGRGTAGVASVNLDAVVPHVDGVQVEYTTDATADVASALAADPSGATGIDWSSTFAANATAVLLLTPEIERNDRGTATVTVTPVGLTRAGQLVADIGGAASRVAVPLSAVSPRTVGSAASSVGGTVYSDADYSFSRTAGEAGVGGVTVQLTGYGFGPNGSDDGGTGDDIPLGSAITTTTAADGSWSIDGLAAGRYTASIVAPQGDAVGQDIGSFTVGASTALTGLDGGVFPALPAPVAVAGTASLPAVGGAVNVLANDSGDASIAVSAVGAVTPAGAATVSISADGTSVVVTPTAGWTGTLQVPYTIRDKQRQTASATESIRIVAAPIALGDSVTIAAGSSALVDALANDTGVGLVLSSVVATSGVTATIENGELRVTAIPGVYGAGSVTYGVVDQLGQTASAQVAVTVNAPVAAADDRVSVDRSSVGADFAVLSNDSGTGLRIVSVTAPAHGTIGISSDGQSLRYVPDGVFTGHDAVVYEIEDTLGATASATVEIAVLNGAAPAPVLAPARAITSVGVPVTIDVLRGATGQGLRLVSVTAPSNGTAVVSGGRVVYTPAPGFVGTDVFTYTATDVLWRTVTNAVSVTVVAPAVSIGLSASTASVGPRQRIDYSLTWGNTLAVSAGTGSIAFLLPAVGDGRGTVGAGALTLLSASSDAGVVVQYTTDAVPAVAAALAVDPTGGTGIAWSTTASPSATAVRFLTPELTPGASGGATVSVATTSILAAGRLVADVDGSASNVAAGLSGVDRTSIASTASSISGTVYLDGDYSFSRGPSEAGVAGVAVKLAGYGFGADGVDDGNTGDDVPVATVTVTTGADGTWTADGLAPGRYWATAAAPTGDTVGQVPAAISLPASTLVTGADLGVFPSIPAPVAVADRARLQATGGIVPVMANDIADPSAVVVAVGAVSPAGAATVSISSDGRSISVSPLNGFTGDLQIPYTIRDKARQSSSSTASVRIVPAPTAVTDLLRFAAGSMGTVDPLTNDTGLGLRLDGIVTASGVTAQASDGLITVRALDGVTGPASVTYRIVDAVGQTATGTVDVVVNAAVVAVDDRVSVDRSSPGIDIPVLANDGGTDLTISSVGAAAHGTITVSSDAQTLHYVPDGVFSGHVTVSYRIEDSLGAAASAQVQIAVLDGPAPIPAAVDDTVELPYDTAGTADVLANDLGQGLELSSLTDPVGAAVEIVDGRVLVIPDENFTGRTTFQYTATDILWRPITGTVTVIVGAPPATSGGTTTTTTTSSRVPASSEPITTTVGPAITTPESTDAAVASGSASSSGSASGAASTSTTQHGVLSTADTPDDGSWWWLLLLLLIPVAWWFLAAARRRRRDDEAAG